MTYQNYEDIRRLMTPAERDEADRQAKAIIADLPLKALRKNLGLSQESVGAKMRANQATVSKLERRGDVSVSMLRKYIEALGGRLCLRAVFDDDVIDLEMGGTDNAPPTSQTVVSAVDVERLVVAALSASGWDPFDTRYVRRNVTCGSTRFDIVLYGAQGALAVIDVKESPPDASDASRLISDAKRIDASFALVTCAGRHWIADTSVPVAGLQRIQRLPVRSDLERIRRRHRQAFAVVSDFVGDARGEDGYEVLSHHRDAAKHVANAFDAGKRRFLVAMAAGAGKTSVYGSIIHAFIKARHAERVLVIADRVDKSMHAGETLQRLLGTEARVSLYPSLDGDPAAIGPHVIVATVAALSRNYRYREQFSPLAFDLVVDIDAHRGPHVAGREVLQYFVAPRLGLIYTADKLLADAGPSRFGASNPRFHEARALRDTYAFFGCEDGIATYRYDLADATSTPDASLVAPTLVDVRCSMTTSALAAKGWDRELAEREAAVGLPEAMRRIFTDERNRSMVRNFFECAEWRRPDHEVAQSVVFALNHEHADMITALFNAQLAGSALTITSRVADASALAASFAAGQLSQSIAVGVDLLATGLDFKDIRNVAMMRPIFSAREYEKIKGCAVRIRGSTPPSPDPALLLDFLANAEYFGEEYTQTWSARRPVNMTTVPATTQSGESAEVSMTNVREAFARDVRSLFEAEPYFREAVASGNDNLVEKLIEEHLLYREPLFYSTLQVTASYGLPASLAAMAYDALGIAALPSLNTVAHETIAALSARFDLHRTGERLLHELFDVVLNDKRALRKFVNGEVSIFRKNRFRALGGLRAVDSLPSSSRVLDAVRESALVQVASLRTPGAA